MKKDKSFSYLVSDLTKNWIQWMNYNAITKNIKLPIKTRGDASAKCEEIIDKRYQIIERLDDFFNGKKK